MLLLVFIPPQHPLSSPSAARCFPRITGKRMGHPGRMETCSTAIPSPASGHFQQAAEGWGSCQGAERAPFVRERLSRGYLNINQHNNRPVFPAPTATLGPHPCVGGDLQSPELLPALETWPGRSLCATPVGSGGRDGLLTSLLRP